jgi:hypothetical protein
MIDDHLSDNSASSQGTRILKWLQTQPLTTLQARHELGTMHPGIRVCELRKAGHRIETVWVKDRTPEGHWHRGGRYVLSPKKQMSLLDLISAATGRDGR